MAWRLLPVIIRFATLKNIQAVPDSMGCVVTLDQVCKLQSKYEKSQKNKDEGHVSLLTAMR